MTEKSGAPPAPVILTCFAGRQACMTLLLRYVRKLLASGCIDEFHAWDFSRKPEDGKWLTDELLLGDMARCYGNRVKIMTVENKGSWVEYYRYYTRLRYPNPDTVIIKCDDDIVFVDADADAFRSHIEFRRAHPEILLLFPSIINNEMCALYQQRAGLVPALSVGTMRGEPGGYGTLWASGIMADRLHVHFCDHFDSFMADSRDRRSEQQQQQQQQRRVVVPINFRVSINFFSILGRDLDLFQYVDGDDERILTQELPGTWARANAIDMGLVVSHLSFGRQTETGMRMEHLLDRYTTLADRCCGLADC